MKIFVAHSSNYDFQNKLYIPLRQSELNSKYDIYLPNEFGESLLTKEIIKNSEIFLAEVSYPSTGQGIEIGWAETFGKPIICFSKMGNKISNSLKKITNNFITYSTPVEMIEKLTAELAKVS